MSPGQEEKKAKELKIRSKRKKFRIIKTKKTTSNFTSVGAPPCRTHIAEDLS